jgi:small subunit ribosomal protein S13
MANVRISGVLMDQDGQQIVIALQKIYGIGNTRAKLVCKLSQTSPSTKIKELAEAQLASIRKIINDEYIVEGDLRREVALNIKALMDLGCYRGRRHRLSLPVNGQNTKNNAQTRKRGRRNKNKGN